MDHAARDVMDEFKDIVLAFGESDEYRCACYACLHVIDRHPSLPLLCSFLFRKSASVYNRREAKILTTVTSLFTSSYVFNWSKYLTDTPLKYCPSFDGRIVLYPSPTVVRDYFSWRQADSEQWRRRKAELHSRSRHSPYQQPVQHRVLGARTQRRPDYDRGTCDFESAHSLHTSVCELTPSVYPTLRGPSRLRSTRSCSPDSK